MSTLNTVNITNGTDSITVEGAVKGSAKAWVNFNGTGVVAIRASFNVSSITDNGTGRYAVNFTTAMADANYCYTYGGKPATDIIAGLKTDFNQTNTTTVLHIQTGSAAAVADFTDVCVAIFR